jgi:site-specific recombinase XerD
MRQATIPITTEGDIAVNLRSFRRALGASRSPRTAETYTEAVEQFARFLSERGMPLVVANIRREHVEEFITALRARWKSATANNRYRSLQAFFRYLDEEGELGQGNPMAKMKPPRVEEQPPAVLSEAELRALLKTCESGQSFEERRDAALFRVFIDTGARLSEIADLRWNPHEDRCFDRDGRVRCKDGHEDNNDVDLDQGLLRVRGKSGRWRLLPLGNRATRSLDRYLRKRSQHSQARMQWLWLGASGKGRMTGSGIRQMFWRRSRQAGIDRIHPHQLRHTFAHEWLSQGGNETDLMRITGWRSRTMVARYGASAATERAMLAAKRLGIGDRV